MEVFRFVVIWSQIILSTCLENLALNKSATQSSNLHDDKWLARAAVDGNGNQVQTGNSCACTGHYKPTVWWKVDLGKVYAMSNVKIFYRNEGTVFRLSGFMLYVTLDDNFISSSPVYVNNNGKQTQPYPPANFTVTAATYGQYVTLYKDRSASCLGEFGSTNTNFCALFELCEVEVLGCPQKKYGTFCLSDCPANCLFDVCAVNDGKCYGCKAGYRGETCDQPCGSGTYGIGCSQTCSGNCKGGITCDVRNGTCPSGCSDGYQGTYCNKSCSPGTYGPSCSFACGSCRKNDICNHISGSCPNGCALGVTGKYCNTTCSYGKYGYNCNESCSRNCLDGVTCNVQTGYCNDGCAAGWKGDKCDTVCNNGTYGRNCLNKCTGNCANETSCSRINGACQHGCKSGWKGNICNQACKDGKYGPGCTGKCGNCINDTICDRQSGACAHGCADGYQEIMCQDECDNGMYGRNCSMKCVLCNATCDHVTGECPYTIPTVVMPPKTDLTTAIAAGVGATVLVIIVIIVVVVFYIRLRQKSKDAERRFSKRISTYLADNKGYMTGPPTVYAEVDKSNNTQRPKEIATPVLSDLYAEVDKNKKIPGPKKNVATGPSVLYAKVDKPNKTPRSKKNVTGPLALYAKVVKSVKPKAGDGEANQGTLYAEVDTPSTTQKSSTGGGDGMFYEDVEIKPDAKKKKKRGNPKEPERHINPQGLVYVDLQFSKTAKKPTRSFEPEERTEYASLEMQ